MVRSITRIDIANTFETTFVYEDSVTGIGAGIHIPINQADDFETTIIAASWATLTALFELEGTTVIKTE
jgi:hypothetical protein